MKPLEVRVPHGLTPDEVRRRLDDAVVRARTEYADTVGPIDAAVLDANLNGLSVTPVAEALAARGVPFVFATGYGEAGGAPLGFDAPVIRKPYDVTQVAAAVAGILAKT